MIEIGIKELQETYKIFRGESKFDLMDFLNQINNEVFSFFVLDKENEILTYNIKPDYFDTNSNTFFVNVCLLKGLKINSQKIALYLMSMGWSGQLNLATVLCEIQNFRSDSFGVSPPLY